MSSRYLIKPAANGWIVEDIGNDDGSNRATKYTQYVFESFDSLTKWLRVKLTTMGDKEESK